jgi:hypothetical protein
MTTSLADECDGMVESNGVPAPRTQLAIKETTNEKEDAIADNRRWKKWGRKTGGNVDAPMLGDAESCALYTPPSSVSSSETEESPPSRPSTTDDDLRKFYGIGRSVGHSL